MDTTGYNSYPGTQFQTATSGSLNLMLMEAPLHLDHETVDQGKSGGAFRAEIVRVEQAISNSERGNQVITTTDDALKRVSNLLNDIRTLVIEATSLGALNEDRLAAHQLQVDSSLEAIDRIAQGTTCQGRKLLDGSLDFTVTNGTNLDNLSDLQIHSADLGTAGRMDVQIAISAAATQGELTAAVPTATPAVKATTRLELPGGAYIDVEAATAGVAANGIDIQIVDDASVEGGDAIGLYDEANALMTVRVNDTAGTAGADVVSAILGTAVVGNAVVGNAVVGNAVVGNARYVQNGASETDYSPGGETNVSGTLGDLVAGADAISRLTGDLVFELNGKDGAEVFNFAKDTTGVQIEDAINLVSDATGVTAAFAGTTLTLTSSAYGEDAFVAVNVISDTGGFEASLSDTRDSGTDIEATVNGMTADGNGNTFSIDIATLDLEATVAAGETGTIAFSITGGVPFRTGPEVMSNQQTRIGLGSVSTASLGGSTGRLCQLGSGESAALATNASLAFRIVEHAGRNVTSLRGRLGAFQKTTLEANIYTLNETTANLTDAENIIRDAEFAAETASLTRAQILVQSGISVLSIANSTPQKVLTLLQ